MFAKKLQVVIQLSGVGPGLGGEGVCVSETLPGDARVVLHLAY